MPVRRVLGTNRPARSPKTCTERAMPSINTELWVALASSFTTSPRSLKDSLIASRSPKNRSFKSLKRFDPTEAGDDIKWLNVSKAATGPGYGGL